MPLLFILVLLFDFERLRLLFELFLFFKLSLLRLLLLLLWLLVLLLLLADRLPSLLNEQLLWLLLILLRLSFFEVDLLRLPLLLEPRSERLFSELLAERNLRIDYMSLSISLMRKSLRFDSVASINSLAIDSIFFEKSSTRLLN